MIASIHFFKSLIALLLVATTDCNFRSSGQVGFCYPTPNPSTSTAPERVPLADVRRAISLLRDKQPDCEVGLLGFSAGAHLATVASVWKAEDPREQPDFSILIYGVTRLNDENRQWLEKTLYHRSLSPEEVEMNQLLDQVDLDPVTGDALYQQPLQWVGLVATER